MISPTYRRAEHRAFRNSDAMSSDLPAPSAPSTHYSDDNGQNEIENGAEEELQNEGTGETFDLDTLEPVTKPLKSKAVEEKPGMFSNGSKETDEKGGAGGPSSAGPSEASRNLASGAEPPGPALKLPDSPAIPTISPPEPRKATFVLPVPSKPAAPSNGLLPRPMASLQVAKPTLSTIKTRQKVVLEPGFGPLDWERLKRSGRDLAVG